MERRVNTVLGLVFTTLNDDALAWTHNSILRIPTYLEKKIGVLLSSNLGGKAMSMNTRVLKKFNKEKDESVMLNFEIDSRTIVCGGKLSEVFPWLHLLFYGSHLIRNENQ